MKEWYRDKNFSSGSVEVIERANEIIDEYVAQGFILSLRQIYYQFVARGWLPNVPQSYKRLGSIVGDARLAGLIDWSHIEDRTRTIRRNSHWSSPAGIIESCVGWYGIDLWKDQEYRCEVWIEKDALVGVIEDVCTENDVPYFSCRGYSSLSAMHRAAHRLKWWENKGAETIIFHLGDHDPSGLDMTRDIEDRMEMFGSQVEVRRIALNMAQIDEIGPPPNPAKTTDARSADYIAEHGEDSWELDALEPSYMVDLVRDSIESVRNKPQWDRMMRRENMDKVLLQKASDRWEELVDELDLDEEVE